MEDMALPPSYNEAPPYDEKRLVFFGRRHGRKLRPRQVEYLEQGMGKYGLLQDMPEAPDVFNPRDLFDPNSSETYLEIGFGGGEHLATRAMDNPTAGFIGAEPFMNGTASLCRHVMTEGITNIRIWPEDVRLLLPRLEGGSLNGVFILFPDPWPKTRHRARRIIQQNMITELARLIPLGGKLLLASDEPTAKTWMLEQMMRRDDFIWTADTAADWRTPPTGWPGTRYMAKADRAGRASSWFSFLRQ